MAVQRSGPAASASPIAWLTSSGCAAAPLAVVGRLFDAAHTALVVEECTVWKRPPSMRSSRIRCPPASAMATATANFASPARPMAVAIIFFAPASVRRLVSVTYMYRRLLRWNSFFPDLPGIGGMRGPAYSSSPHDDGSHTISREYTLRPIPGGTNAG